jgi:hypothetical protein
MPDDAGQPDDLEMSEENDELEKVRKPELISAGTDSPKGLENALTKVKNENARMRLQENIEKFQLKYQERLQKMEGVEVEDVDEETGAVEVKAKEPVKYLGFIKGKATKRFNINAEGKIEEKAPWYRFLYADQKIEEVSKEEPEVEVEEEDTEVVEEEISAED